MIAEAQAILKMSAKDWTEIVVAVMAVAAFIVAVGGFRVSSLAHCDYRNNGTAETTAACSEVVGQPL